MELGRITRAVALGATLALVLGAFIGPAEAAKKKKKKPKVSCPAFTPAEPETSADNGAEALEAPVAPVNDAHTAEAPLTIEFDHGAALWVPFTTRSVQEDTKFFNIQVFSKAPSTHVYIRQEWAPGPGTDDSDIDLYVYGADGAEVEHSGAFNPAPIGAVSQADLSDRARGGNGFESIPGMAAAQCDGYTIESRAFMTRGEAMTLKIWLGAPPAEG